MLAAFALLGIIPGWADGLANNGHICGPSSTLVLNSEQIKSLDSQIKVQSKTKRKPPKNRKEWLERWPQIRLTAEQSNNLFTQSGVCAVEKLYVLPANLNTCACECANVAIRVSKNKIEIADYLLDNPKSQQEHKDWIRQKDLDLNKTPQTLEAKLTKQGMAIQETQPEKAIEFYEAALRANPKFKWANFYMVETYHDMGLRAICRLDPERSRKYMDLAANYSRPEFISQHKRILLEQKRAYAVKEPREMRAAQK